MKHEPRFQVGDVLGIQARWKNKKRYVVTRVYYATDYNYRMDLRCMQDGTIHPGYPCDVTIPTEIFFKDAFMSAANRAIQGAE